MLGLTELAVVVPMVLVVAVLAWIIIRLIMKTVDAWREGRALQDRDAQEHHSDHP